MEKRRIWESLFLLVMVSGLLLVYLPVSANSVEQTKVLQTMVQALEKTGTRITDIELRASMQLGKVSSPKELEDLAMQWNKRLSMEGNGIAQREQNKIVYESSVDFHGARLHSRLIGLHEKNNIHAYLVLSITGKRVHLQDIESLYQSVMKSCKHAGMIPQFSTCIHGRYSDTLSVDQQEGIISFLLKELDAKRIEALQDETVTSVSAYTKQWSSYITTNNHKMNVQVATHVDTLSKLTRITIGTPIITAEY